MANEAFSMDEKITLLHRTISEQNDLISVLKSDISALTNSVAYLEKQNSILQTENRQLLEGRDFLTKAIDNAAVIETKMANCLKDQRMRIDALERDNNELEANEGRQQRKLEELERELVITRDAYWYLKEKLGP